MSFIDRSFREKILIVGVVLPNVDLAEVHEDLDELELLIQTAGAETVGRVVQVKRHYDPTYLIGKGKAFELKELCERLDVDTVVFDVSLKSNQKYALEKILGRTAIDREAVILDIFAQNAHSMEGKLQVERALLEYRMAHLTGRGLYMSRLAGGIGTRGPGETKLETDRRRIQARIFKLDRELKCLLKSKNTQFERRDKTGVKEISLVGYTNAGKTSLHNVLCKERSLVSEKLFSTLDSKSRKVYVENYGTFILSDTVGFIKKLPHSLISAFNSTLSQVRRSDLIVHVIDCTDSDIGGKMKEVDSVLKEIGANDIPRIIVFNKADKDPRRANDMCKFFDSAIQVSALTGYNVKELIENILDKLRQIERVSANYVI